MLVNNLVSNHQKLLVFIRRDIDLRSHYSSHLLRYFSSFDTIFPYFYNCRHMFRPIGTPQYSQKLKKKKGHLSRSIKITDLLCLHVWPKKYKSARMLAYRIPGSRTLFRYIFDMYSKYS